jgi:hypothetical protein
LTNLPGYHRLRRLHFFSALPPLFLRQIIPAGNRGFISPAPSPAAARSAKAAAGFFRLFLKVLFFKDKIFFYDGTEVAMYLVMGNPIAYGVRLMNRLRAGIPGAGRRSHMVWRRFFLLPVVVALLMVSLLLPGAVPVGIAADDGGQVIEMVEILRRKERQLDERERQLDEREARLKILKKEIEAKGQGLKDLRRQVDEAMAAYRTLKDEDLSRLVEVFAAMKPDAAAPLVEKLELKYAMEVILRMQPRKAAKLLAAIEPKRAREISRGITVLQGVAEGQ